MSTIKNYVGNGKKLTTKYGEIINVSLKLSDLQKIVNEKGYINITISEMKQPDKYGNTLTAYENNYKPQPKTTNADEDISSEVIDDLSIGTKEDLMSGLPF